MMPPRRRFLFTAACDEVWLAVHVASLAGLVIGPAVGF